MSVLMKHSETGKVMRFEGGKLPKGWVIDNSFNECTTQQMCIAYNPNDIREGAVYRVDSKESFRFYKEEGYMIVEYEKYCEIVDNLDKKRVRFSV